MTQIPSPAFWLGWAGVLPFAALSALTHMDTSATTGIEQGDILRALIAYGMIILSFMGGVQWGLEMTRGDGKSSNALGFAASVVPALIAFGTFFVNPLAALVILALGFVLLLTYDLRRVRAGIGPGWYAGLRFQLSTAVVLCLGTAMTSRLPAFT
ncbi:MAG: DUF3429 domain-containing protein [Hyphomicrobium sp.]|nr:DUF3429 domain-containing protein [Hyphomicrobium sp.]